VSNGPLRVPSEAIAGGNGVYQAGNNSFPNVDGSGMNFWVDVAFSPTSSPASAPASQAPSTAGRPSSSVAPTLESNRSTQTIPAAPANSATTPSTSATDSRASGGQTARTNSGSWRFYRTVPQGPGWAYSHTKESVLANLSSF